jgi:hypothetical protein
MDQQSQETSLWSTGMFLGLYRIRAPSLLVQDVNRRPTWTPRGLCRKPLSDGSQDARRLASQAAKLCFCRATMFRRRVACTLAGLRQYRLRGNLIAIASKSIPPGRSTIGPLAPASPLVASTEP